jgi:hypothetical protein
VVAAHAPVPVFAAVAAASGAQVLLTDQVLHSQIAFPVALYSVARFATVGPAAIALAVGLVASAVASVDWLLGFDGERARSRRTSSPWRASS